MEVTNNVVSKAGQAVESGRMEQRRPPKEQWEVSEKTGGSANKSPTHEEIEKAFKEMAQKTNLKVDVSQDQQSGLTVVRIYTGDGGKLLWQIPAKAVMNIIDRYSSGDASGFFSSKV